MEKNLKSKPKKLIRSTRKRKPKPVKICIMCGVDLQRGENKGICKLCLKQGENNFNKVVNKQMDRDKEKNEN